MTSRDDKNRMFFRETLTYCFRGNFNKVLIKIDICDFVKEVFT